MATFYNDHPRGIEWSQDIGSGLSRTTDANATYIVKNKIFPFASNDYSIIFSGHLMVGDHYGSASATITKNDSVLIWSGQLASASGSLGGRSINVTLSYPGSLAYPIECNDEITITIQASGSDTSCSCNVSAAFSGNVIPDVMRTFMWDVYPATATYSYGISTEPSVKLYVPTNSSNSITYSGDGYSTLFNNRAEKYYFKLGKASNALWVSAYTKWPVGAYSFGFGVNAGSMNSSQTATVLYSRANSYSYIDSKGVYLLVNKHTITTYYNAVKTSATPTATVYSGSITQYPVDGYFQGKWYKLHTESLPEDLFIQTSEQTYDDELLTTDTVYSFPSYTFDSNTGKYTLVQSDTDSCIYVEGSGEQAELQSNGTIYSSITVNPTNGAISGSGSSMINISPLSWYNTYISNYPYFYVGGKWYKIPVASNTIVATEVVPDFYNTLMPRTFGTLYNKYPYIGVVDGDVSTTNSTGPFDTIIQQTGYEEITGSSENLCKVDYIRMSSAGNQQGRLKTRYTSSWVRNVGLWAPAGGYSSVSFNTQTGEYTLSGTGPVSYTVGYYYPASPVTARGTYTSIYYCYSEKELSNTGDISYNCNLYTAKLIIDSAV